MKTQNLEPACVVELNVLRLRLIALFEILSEHRYSFCSVSFYSDFASISTRVNELLDAPLWSGGGGIKTNGSDVATIELVSRVRQLLAVLNAVLAAQEAPERSLIEQARDDDLRKRCTDILNSGQAFDRAINQATLVFEDKLRKYSKLAGESGQSLVSKAINRDPAKSIVKMSTDADQQEGYAEIARGLIRAFRNPTHHVVRDDYTRAEAEAVCIFIDHLLDVVKRSITG